MDEKLEWSRLITGSVYDAWPKDEAGELEEPVFLCHCRNICLEDAIRMNMLRSCGIPCLGLHPGDGSFGSLILGVSGMGTHIYVPKSLFEDAKALIEEENSYEL